LVVLLSIRPGEMAFCTSPAPRAILEIPLDAPPVLRMGVRSACFGTVTLDTDIPIGMTGLAGLQVPPGLDRMLIQGGSIFLAIRAKHLVRLDPQRPFRETVVTVAAERRFMAAAAGLGIIQGLDRMDVDEIAPVAFRDEIRPVILLFKLGIDAAAAVAVKAVRLVVALGAVTAAFASQLLVRSLPPVGRVVGSDTFRFVAAVAFGNFHRCVLFVRHLFCDCLMHIQHR
jgi:hypothetical protein